MATLEDLKAKWITDYIPTESDYAELFDFIAAQGGGDTDPVMKKAEVEFSLAEFSTEGNSINVPETSIDIIPEPEANQLVVIHGVYVAARLTPPYRLSLSGVTDYAVGTVSFNGSAIGSFQLSTSQLSSTPLLYATGFQYNDQVAVFTGAPVNISINGTGTAVDDPSTALLEMKYTALYSIVEAFPFTFTPPIGG